MTRFHGRFGAWVTSGYPQAAREALELQLREFTAQLDQLLALSARQHVLAFDLVRVGLGDPVVDRLLRGLKLLGKLPRTATGPN